VGTFNLSAGPYGSRWRQVTVFISESLALQGVVHFKKKTHPHVHVHNPRFPCLSFFSRKEIKVFDENIPGFFIILVTKQFKVQKTVSVQTVQGL